jgi:hypothetical protein
MNAGLAGGGRCEKFLGSVLPYTYVLGCVNCSIILQKKTKEGRTGDRYRKPMHPTIGRHIGEDEKRIGTAGFKKDAVLHITGRTIS